MKASAIRKAIVAALGVAAIVLPDVFGLELRNGLENVVDGVLGIATAYGVFQIKNEPATARERI